MTNNILEKLKEIFAKQYKGLDDDFLEAFDKFVSELTDEEIYQLTK